MVDFEDSGVSDPADEIADLLEHPSARLPALIGADDLIYPLSIPVSGGPRCACSAC